MNSSGWGVGIGGDSINSDGAEGGGYEIHKPSTPGRAKAKGSQHVFYIGPAKFVKSFRKINFKKHSNLFVAI